MKKKKVEATGVSLSEALSSLSKLGESGRESVIHARGQRAISSLFASHSPNCDTNQQVYRVTSSINGKN